MTRAAKSKLARQSTAAYAASQPLFDSLRIGCASVGEQKKHLAIARDLVQNLHVKIVNTDSAGDVDRQQQYMDCAVKAWRSATEVYADIFKELAKITAAEPNLGKEERDGHADFAEMARSAAAARQVANGFQLYEDAARERVITPGPRGGEVRMRDAGEEDDDNDGSDAAIDATSDSSSASEVEQENAEEVMANDTKNTTLLHSLGKRAHPGVSQDTEIKQRPQKAQRLDVNANDDAEDHKVLGDKSATKFEAPGKNETDARRAEKTRQRREAKQQKRVQSRAEESRAKIQEPSTAVNGALSGTNGGTPGLREVANGTAMAGVEFEDLSAEVDARLKAKNEAREAKKKEKKRKRESGDSLVVQADNVNFAKPSKKKAKAEEWGAWKVDNYKQSEKRGRELEDTMNGGRSRKRKKKQSKASSQGAAAP